MLKLLQTQLQTMIESQSKADRTPPTMVSLLEQITKLDNSQGSVDSVIMELIQEINTERAVSAPTITETVEEQQNTSSSETPATVTEAELNTITSLEQEQQKL